METEANIANLRKGNVTNVATIASDRHHRTRRRAFQRMAFASFRLAAVINGLALFTVVFFLVYNGWRAINWTFLSQPPINSMTQGGIFPCLVGTFYLSFGAMLVAFPLGVASAIYLQEYAQPGPIVRAIRLGINNLAGVPSVVFGLFGLAFFVIWCKFGVSLLSGALTLAALILPVIIGTAEKALHSVPATYREASLALGATKWQTIYRVVLPAALPGMLTGAILGISRAAGEHGPGSATRSRTSPCGTIWPALPSAACGGANTSKTWSRNSEPAPWPPSKRENLSYLPSKWTSFAGRQPRS